MSDELEGRMLLSATVSGTDTAGDKWTLTLTGKGSIQVLKQNDSTGNPGALNSATEIKSIVLSGTDPFSSKLTDTVVPAAGSSGRIFFQNLTEIPNHSLKSTSGLGPYEIDIPDFYLGITDPTIPTSVSQPRAQISIPDGVNILKFGGVDTTAFFGTDQTQSPSGDNTNDEFLIRLGVPYENGTSIYVNTVKSSAEAAAASTSGSTTSPTQKSVVFLVSGRINIFQANSITGDTTSKAAAASGYTGGTIVSAITDTATSSNGPIGFVRVGGNATDFSVASSDKLGNFYIGGETANVAILAPTGARDLYFGKGMDTVTLYANSIENLFANRDITDSNVVSNRMIGNIMTGGDVVNSTILSGYDQNLANFSSSVQSNISSITSASGVTQPTPNPQANGMITAYVAGSIQDSVFAASDQPYSTLTSPTTLTFGDPRDVFLPLGVINAHVEGTISNSSATPQSPNTAFYAKKVILSKMPVSPPNVPEMPFGSPSKPIYQPLTPPLIDPATVPVKAAATTMSSTVAIASHTTKTHTVAKKK
jgi:hypothetical protein